MTPSPARTKSCPFPGCDKPLTHWRSRACSRRHFGWLRRHGLLTDAKRCSVPGCDRPHDAKGYCQPHYRQFEAPDPGVCSVEGCSKKVAGKGLCLMHYVRVWEGRALISQDEQFIKENPPKDGIGLVPVRSHHGMVVATVDAEDYARAIALPWWTSTYGGVTYPITHVDGKDLRMGQFILNTDGKQRVTYLDKNPLHCRRSNLRRCSYSQMMAASRTLRLPNKSSKYRGVSWDRSTNKWVAYVSYQGKMHRLGYFRDEVAAACARDEKALELYGEFARLNFPDGPVSTPPAT